jgi:hypothetical protein
MGTVSERTPSVTESNKDPVGVYAPPLNNAPLTNLGIKLHFSSECFTSWVPSTPLTSPPPILISCFYSNKIKLEQDLNKRKSNWKSGGG